MVLTVRRWCVAASWAALLAVGDASTVRAEDQRSGTIAGEIKSKNDTKDGRNVVLEVLAPGEEKARSYHVRYDEHVKGPLPAVLKAVRASHVGDRVEFDWVATGHGPAITKFHVTKKAAHGDDKKEEHRHGTVTGVVTAKGDNWIEVKADGEEKGRRYVPHWRGGAPRDGGGPDKKMVAEIKAVPVMSRVRLEWSFEERPRVEKIEVLKKPAPEKKKDSSRRGTVTGVVTAKGDHWLEVKGDGEEKARRYIPHWHGGNPADGGGLDKKVLAEIEAVPVKSRVRLEWVSAEGPRVEKVEILHNPESEKKK